jgi:microcystin-dependent protein
MVVSGTESPENVAMSEPFIGEVRMFAGSFAPRGWALCDGRLLSISQHSALFSVLGTAYGGDGMTTFALPDLRGRVPLHPGSGPGLTLQGTALTDWDQRARDTAKDRRTNELQPYTPVNFIIALEGSFPARG